MPEGPAIAVENLGKRFGEGPLVLDNVSFSASSGEIIAIVGPSGCGKSTLLRLLAGLLQPTSGRICKAGEGIQPAFIFQDPTLLPWATVEANVALPLRLRGIAKSERLQTARLWARRLGLADALNYHPRQLSGGMRMRVSIARALSLQPSLILFDEPFGALDAITRNRLNEEILALHKTSRWTAFFVTHSVTEAVFLSHRLVILGTAPGRVSAILENPLPFPRNLRTRESLSFQEQVTGAFTRLQEVLSQP